MNEENFFDRILSLPLFQGISKSDFLEIAGRVKLNFQKKTAKSVLVKQGDLCTGLHFILKGEIEVVKVNDQNDAVLYEWMNSPMVLQPEAMFGLTTRYVRTFITDSPSQILHIDKAAVRDALLTYSTFRINYLNLISYRVQCSNKLLWRDAPQSLENRFVIYLLSNCLHPAGRKMLKVDMKNLADKLLTTRLQVSKMLNQLEKENLLELYRGRMIIPHMEKLITR